MNQEQSKQGSLKILLVDDHEAILEGTLNAIQRQYPEAEIQTAQTAQSAQELVKSFQPDLIVMDLSIPEQAGISSKADTGIQTLRNLMKSYPNLNIVVQSAHVKSLLRLKPNIDAHEGGFTVADKNLSLKEMLNKVEWAIQGLVYTPKEMRVGLEVKPEWLELLTLAFQEGLQDKTIAEKMSISERTVRHHWSKIQNVLGIYPEPGKNIRIQTEIRAREEGLID